MQEQPITVYIVEDEEVLRHDFERAVRSDPRLQLLGATGSAQLALHKLANGLNTDVLLVDLGLPDGDGTQLISCLRRHSPQSKALVISVFADEWRMLNALSAGAQGYLLKEATDQELVRAIKDVMKGNAPLSAQVARYLLRAFEKPAASPPTAPKPEVLTMREAEILMQISRGQTVAQVAARMGLSQHTVSTHLRNCYAKLNAKNRMQAINRAKEMGQIT